MQLSQRIQQFQIEIRKQKVQKRIKKIRQSILKQKNIELGKNSQYQIISNNQYHKDQQNDQRTTKLSQKQIQEMIENFIRDINLQNSTSVFQTIKKFTNLCHLLEAQDLKLFLAQFVEQKAHLLFSDLLYQTQNIEDLNIILELLIILLLNEQIVEHFTYRNLLPRILVLIKSQRNLSILENSIWVLANFICNVYIIKEGCIVMNFNRELLDMIEDVQQHSDENTKYLEDAYVYFFKQYLSTKPDESFNILRDSFLFCMDYYERYKDQAEQLEECLFILGFFINQYRKNFDKLVKIERLMDILINCLYIQNQLDQQNIIKICDQNSQIFQNLTFSKKFHKILFQIIKSDQCLSEILKLFSQFAEIDKYIFQKLQEDYNILQILYDKLIQYKNIKDKLICVEMILLFPQYASRVLNFYMNNEDILQLTLDIIAQTHSLNLTFYEKILDLIQMQLDLGQYLYKQNGFDPYRDCLLQNEDLQIIYEQFLINHKTKNL